MSQQTVPQYYRRAYQDFSGGLQTRPHALEVDANKFTQLDNCILADHSILEKAPGYAVDGNPWANVSDSFIRMIVNYRVGTSVNSLVVAAQDDNNTNATFKVDLKQTFGDGTYNYIGYTIGTALFTSGSPTVTGTGTAWDVNLKAGDQIKPNSFGTWYVIQSVDSATQVTLTTNYGGSTTMSVAYMARIVLNFNAIPNATTFNNHLVIVDGVDKAMVFDNTSLTLLQNANVPVGASFVTKHKNRVFMARSTSAPSSIFWSSVNDETTWNAAGNAPVMPSDNGNICGFVSYANSLIVFKDNGNVYQVYGEFDQSAVGQPALIRRIDNADNIGIISGRSAVVNDDNLLYFMAETGVYTIDPRMYVQKISWDINPTIQNLVLNGTAGSSPKSFAFAQKSQWDTGTLSGTQDFRPTNGIAPYFDSGTITGAFQGQASTNGSGNRIACSTATAIDSSGNLHVAWISTDKQTLFHTAIAAVDNSSSTTTVTTVAGLYTLGSYIDAGIFGVAMDIASNGKVGIMIVSLSHDDNSSQGGNPGGSSQFTLAELSGGAWSINVDYRSAKYPSYSDFGSVQVCFSYAGGTTPHAVFIDGNTSATVFAVYSGSWANTSLTDYGPPFFEPFKVSLNIDGSGNIRIATSGTTLFTFTPTGRIYYYLSTNGGASFTTPLSSSSLGTPYINTTNFNPNVFIRLDDSGNVVVTYANGSSSAGSEYTEVATTISQYNFTPHTPTNTVIVSGTNWIKAYSNIADAQEVFYYVPTSNNQETIRFDVAYKVGTATFTGGNASVSGQGTKWTTWVHAGDLIRLSSDSTLDYGVVQSVNSDTSITLTAPYAGSSGATQPYTAKHTYSVSSGTSGTLTNSYTPGDVAAAQNAGVFALVGLGSSANSVQWRRLTLFGKWISPIESDANLQSWGTFVVGGQTTGGNTILYEIGLSTTSTILVINTNLITSGSLISANNSLDFAQATITFILQAFAAASVLSITLNYTGTGASSRSATAFVFNNEIYAACSPAGVSNNTLILFLDWRHAWGDTTIPAFCFARMNQTLYAGSSAGGQVFKLKTGYNMAGSAYSMTAVTKEDILGSLELQKDLYKAYVIYKVQSGGTFTFSYSLDNYLNGGATNWVDTVVNQTSSSNTPGFQEIPIGSTASSIQFKIAQNDADVQVGIVGIVLLYGYLNVR